MGCQWHVHPCFYTFVSRLKIKERGGRGGKGREVLLITCVLELEGKERKGEDNYVLK